MGTDRFLDAIDNAIDFFLSVAFMALVVLIASGATIIVWG